MNLNDYIDRLPMSFRTRGGKKAVVYFQDDNTGDFYGKTQGSKFCWNKNGEYWLDRDLEKYDIISEWQDEPIHDPKTGNISVNGETVAHDLVMRKTKNHSENKRDMVLTPELLEDIKKGVKAWEVINKLDSLGKLLINKEIMFKNLDLAIQQINSEDK